MEMKSKVISTGFKTARNGLDTEGGTNVWILSYECGEVMFSASRKPPRSHLRCEGIRSTLVADSVSTVTKVNTLEL